MSAPTHDLFDDDAFVKFRRTRGRFETPERRVTFVVMRWDNQRA
jgi:hypothetical protein